MITVVIKNFPCPVCQKETPHVYIDNDMAVVCLTCRAKDIETVTKLVNPIVVIGDCQN